MTKHIPGVGPEEKSSLLESLRKPAMALTAALALSACDTTLPVEKEAKLVTCPPFHPVAELEQERKKRIDLVRAIVASTSPDSTDEKKVLMMEQGLQAEKTVNEVYDRRVADVESNLGPCEDTYFVMNGGPFGGGIHHSFTNDRGIDMRTLRK